MGQIGKRGFVELGAKRETMTPTKYQRWLCKQCGWVLEDEDNMVVHVQRVHRQGLARKIVFTQHEGIEINRGKVQHLAADECRNKGDL